MALNLTLYSTSNEEEHSYGFVNFPRVQSWLSTENYLDNDSPFAHLHERIKALWIQIQAVGASTGCVKLVMAA